jgi:CRISPR/Cas system CSM-associated protein Csm2 small subunit
VLVFPRESKNYSDEYFSDGEVINIIGSINKDGDEENAVSKIVLNSCDKLDLSNFAGGKPIYLKINGGLKQSDINKLYDIINESNGGSYVFLQCKEDNKTINLKFNKTTSIKQKEKLEEILKEIM